MTSDDSSLFSPPGTPGYAEADSSFQLAAPVDPAGAFTARSIDDVVRAAARRADRPLLLNTTSHAMGRTATLNRSLMLRPLIDATRPRRPGNPDGPRARRQDPGRHPAVGMNGFVIWPGRDHTRQISAFAAEVVPAVREALAHKT